MAVDLQSTDSSPPQEEYWNCVSLPMAGGRHTLVDVEDFERLVQHRWPAIKTGMGGNGCYAGRRQRNQKPLVVFVHHEVTGRPAPGFVVDDIDGNKMDNRRKNLRVCTNEENLWNGKHRRSGKGKFRGVYFDPEVVQVGGAVRDERNKDLSGQLQLCGGSRWSVGC